MVIREEGSSGGEIRKGRGRWEEGSREKLRREEKRGGKKRRKWMAGSGKKGCTGKGD